MTHESEDRCQYCGSNETIKHGYYTMCDSCHEAFMAGQQKGAEIEERLSRYGSGVRGREEVEEKLEEIEGRIKNAMKISERRNHALRSSHLSKLQRDKRRLEWFSGCVTAYDE